MIALEIAQHTFIKCLELLNVNVTAPRMVEESTGQFIADVLRGLRAAMAYNQMPGFLLDAMNEGEADLALGMAATRTIIHADD